MSTNPRIDTLSKHSDYAKKVGEAAEEFGAEGGTDLAFYLLTQGEFTLKTPIADAARLVAQLILQP